MLVYITATGVSENLVEEIKLMIDVYARPWCDDSDEGYYYLCVKAGLVLEKAFIQLSEENQIVKLLVILWQKKKGCWSSCVNQLIAFGLISRDLQ